jgi:hypothetical protein
MEQVAGGKRQRGPKQPFSSMRQDACLEIYADLVQTTVVDAASGCKRKTIRSPELNFARIAYVSRVTSGLSECFHMANTKRPYIDRLQTTPYSWRDRWRERHLHYFER